MNDRKAETHIRVQESTWERLNRRKRVGDSFDDVISRLLDEAIDDKSFAELMEIALEHADNLEEARDELDVTQQSFDDALVDIFDDSDDRRHDPKDGEAAV